MFRNKAFADHPPILTITIEIMYNAKTHADLITVKDSKRAQKCHSYCRPMDFPCKMLDIKIEIQCDINVLG